MIPKTESHISHLEQTEIVVCGMVLDGGIYRLQEHRSESISILNVYVVERYADGTIEMPYDVDFPKDQGEHAMAYANGLSLITGWEIDEV